MRTMAGMLLGIGLSSTAWAADWDYQSEQRVLDFHDEYDAFGFLGIDTGYLPAGSPVAFRFFVDTGGGVITDMVATSDVVWPDPLTQIIEPVPGSGYLKALLDIEVGAELYYDFIIVNDTIDLFNLAGIPTPAYDIGGDRVFNPLALSNSHPESVNLEISDHGTVPPIELDFEVFPGFSISGGVQLVPELISTLRGLRIETETADGDIYVMDQQGQEVLMSPPVTEPGLVDLASTYFAEVFSSLELVLEVYVDVSVNAIIFQLDFNILNFDIPLPLGVTANEVRAFDPVIYDHPIPAANTDVRSHDFGDVDPGNLANFAFPLENIGYLDLEAWATIVGDPSITVFPEYMHATPGNEDGVVVTFAPTSSGPVEALLVVATNDPLHPLLEIPLTANGASDDPDPGDPGDPDDPDAPGKVDAELKTCGCSSSSGGFGGLGMLALAPMVLVRRRRR